MWAGVHYFRRSHAILANMPWMDQTHILMSPLHESQWSYLDPDAEAAKFGGSTSEFDFILVDGPNDNDLERMAIRAGMRAVGDDGGMVSLYGK
jgi:hypothetical protein